MGRRSAPDDDTARLTSQSPGAMFDDRPIAIPATAPSRRRPRSRLSCVGPRANRQRGAGVRNVLGTLGELDSGRGAAGIIDPWGIEWRRRQGGPPVALGVATDGRGRWRCGAADAVRGDPACHPD